MEVIRPVLDWLLILSIIGVMALAAVLLVTT